MGAKALYVDTALKIIAALKTANNLKLLAGIEHDKESYKNYSKDWPSANLDEFLAKHGIAEKYMTVNQDKRKIIFSKTGFDYEIVCAVGARYFRIQKKGYTDENGKWHGPVYVDINLKEPKLPKGVVGSQAKAERKRLTHYRMTYKKGVNK